jgi:hypothetical protein
MKKLILLAALVLPAISHAKKDIVYNCVDIKTKQEVKLTIQGDGTHIGFSSFQTRKSAKPDAQLDGRPAYQYEGDLYSGVTLPEEIMTGQSARGRIYQVGYDYASHYDCVILNN